MAGMRDMLPWHISYIKYKNPDLENACLFSIHKQFKKTNWQTQDAKSYFAGWKAACTLLNVRFDDLLAGLGRAKDV